jgi:hypothetical protein
MATGWYCPQSLASSCRRDHGKSSLTKVIPNEIARGLIVVDDQHAFAATKLGRGSADLLLADCGRLRDGQANGEGRSFAGFAGYRHVATHHATKASRDRQTEPGPAVVARGRGIPLGEFLEQPLHLFSVHADAGIGYCKLDTVLLFMRRAGDPQNDAAAS